MLALLLEAAFRSFLLGIAVWLGVVLLRARDTQAEASAWIGVLTASLAMPVLMQLTPITIVVPAPLSSIGTAFHISPLAELIAVWLAINVLRARNHGEAMAWITLLAASFAMQLVAEFMAITAAVPGLQLNATAVVSVPSISSMPSYVSDLLAVLTISVTLAMLLRLTAGLFLSWRVFQRARPVYGDWTRGCAVRVSAAIAMPGTLGSTILLPKEYVGWSQAKQRAVIAHESSHVRRRDFYLQLLAAIHRCLFWFSPLAWYLEARLALLAEMASDDAAVSAMGDRPEYADLLFQFAAKESPMIAIAMARPEKIAERIDRVLAQTVITPALTGRKRLLLFTSLVPLIAGAAGLSLAAQTGVPNAPHVKRVSLSIMEGPTNYSEQHERNPSHATRPTPKPTGGNAPIQR